MSNKPKMKEQFDEKYGSATSDELQREILYQLFKSNELSEKIRINTNTLVVWLVVLPVLIFIMMLLVESFIV